MTVAKAYIERDASLIVEYVKVNIFSNSAGSLIFPYLFNRCEKVQPGMITGASVVRASGNGLSLKVQMYVCFREPMLRLSCLD